MIFAITILAALSGASLGVGIAIYSSIEVIEPPRTRPKKSKKRKNKKKVRKVPFGFSRALVKPKPAR